MVVMEYIVTCPRCKTETKIVGEQTNPIMYTCKGCDRAIVVEPSRVYTVSVGYMKKLISRHKSRACGQIVALRLSDKARKIVSSDRMEALHELLSEDMDVDDFVRRLG